MDENLADNEDVMGLCNIGIMDPDSLVKVFPTLVVCSADSLLISVEDTVWHENFTWNLILWFYG